MAFLLPTSHILKHLVTLTTLIPAGQHNALALSFLVYHQLPDACAHIALTIVVILLQLV